MELSKRRLNTPKYHRMKANQVKVVGGLQKGDEPNEYVITGEDRKKYGFGVPRSSWGPSSVGAESFV